MGEGSGSGSLQIVVEAGVSSSAQIVVTSLGRPCWLSLKKGGLLISSAAVFRSTIWGEVVHFSALLLCFVFHGSTCSWSSTIQDSGSPGDVGQLSE